MKANGKILRSLREAHQITQIKLADYLDLCQCEIEKFENNEGSLSLDQLEKCAVLFSCKLQALYNEEELDVDSKSIYPTQSHDIDLQTMAMINRIAMNLSLMEEIDTQSFDESLRVESN